MIDQKKFVIVALALDKKAFIIYVAYLGAKMLIHIVQQAQITLLLVKKVSISEEYANFLDIFSKKSAIVLFEYSNINKHAIDLESSKQPSYKPVYSLSLVELEILKTYIKINLANGFIKSSKSSAKLPIFFVWKPDGSFHLYVNYCGLNNLTIEN